MKTQFVEAEERANAILARAGRILSHPASRQFFALAALVSALFLFSGCEMMNEVFVPPTSSSTNYSKGTGEIAAVPAAPPSPKKQAEFDVMMERLENRSPAPTITPRSEPVSAAVTSPKAPASSPGPTPAPTPTRVAAATPPPQAEPLIIRATPPPPSRAGASQLLATNPPPKPAETAVVPAVPPRVVQSLVVVGSHKPPPKTYRGWKTLLLIGLVLLLASSFLLSFAPVRERLLTVKVAATVWWSTRKMTDKGKSESKGRDQNRGPAWIETVAASTALVAARMVVWVKALPFFARGNPAPQTEVAPEQHRPTPAEMLLKKIGAPPSKDISTSRSDKAKQSAESSTLPVVASQTPGEKASETSNQAQPAGAPVAAASDVAAKAAAAAENQPAQSRVNKVLQAPFTPAIITLMSPPPEPPVVSNGKSAEVLAGPSKPSGSAATEQKQGDNQPGANALANGAGSSSQPKADAKPSEGSEKEPQRSQKVDEPVTA